MLKKYKNDINIYPHNTLLKLKKKWYYGNDSLSLAWDFKTHFFMRTNFVTWRVGNFFFNENSKFSA